jgi:hypothetical protein
MILGGRCHGAAATMRSSVNAVTISARGAAPMGRPAAPRGGVSLQANPGRRTSHRWRRAMHRWQGAEATRPRNLLAPVACSRERADGLLDESVALQALHSITFDSFD